MRKRTVAAKRRKKLGDQLVEAMREAVQHAEGRRSDLRTHVVRVRIPDIDVRLVRRKTGLSQDRFAAKFGFSPATLREWEQRRRMPSGAARVLLHIIDREPEVVLRALAR
jgi:putative transcriptional regulator